MLSYMSTTIVTLIIIAFFTSPESGLDYSNLEHIARNEPAMEEGFQKEEYIIEDYETKLYEENDCQDCLHSAEDFCADINAECATGECSEWLDCIGWGDAYEGEADCYDECDEKFVKSDNANIELRICACNHCALKCKHMC